MAAPTLVDLPPDEIKRRYNALTDDQKHKAAELKRTGRSPGHAVQIVEAQGSAYTAQQPTTGDNIGAGILGAGKVLSAGLSDEGAGVVETVKQNPIKSLLAAPAAGLLVPGLILEHMRGAGPESMRTGAAAQQAAEQRIYDKAPLAAGIGELTGMAVGGAVGPGRTGAQAALTGAQQAGGGLLRLIGTGAARGAEAAALPSAGMGAVAGLASGNTPGERVQMAGEGAATGLAAGIGLGALGGGAGGAANALRARSSPPPPPVAPSAPRPLPGGGGGGQVRALAGKVPGVIEQLPGPVRNLPSVRAAGAIAKLIRGKDATTAPVAEVTGATEAPALRARPSAIPEVNPVEAPPPQAAPSGQAAAAKAGQLQALAAKLDDMLRETAPDPNRTRAVSPVAQLAAAEAQAFPSPRTQNTAQGWSIGVDQLRARGIPEGRAIPSPQAATDAPGFMDFALSRTTQMPDDLGTNGGRPGNVGQVSRPVDAKTVQMPEAQATALRQEASGLPPVTAEGQGAPVPPPRTGVQRVRAADIIDEAQIAGAGAAPVAEIGNLGAKLPARFEPGAMRSWVESLPPGDRAQALQRLAQEYPEHAQSNVADIARALGLEEPARFTPRSMARKKPGSDAGAHTARQENAFPAGRFPMRFANKAEADSVNAMVESLRGQPPSVQQAMIRGIRSTEALGPRRDAIADEVAARLARHAPVPPAPKRGIMRFTADGFPVDEDLEFALAQQRQTVPDAPPPDLDNPPAPPPAARQGDDPAAVDAFRKAKAKAEAEQAARDEQERLPEWMRYTPQPETKRTLPPEVMALPPGVRKRLLRDMASERTHESQNPRRTPHQRSEKVFHPLRGSYAMDLAAGGGTGPGGSIQRGWSEAAGADTFRRRANETAADHARRIQADTEALSRAEDALIPVFRDPPSTPGRAHEFHRDVARAATKDAAGSLGRARYMDEQGIRPSLASREREHASFVKGVMRENDRGRRNLPDIPLPAVLAGLGLSEAQIQRILDEQQE